MKNYLPKIEKFKIPNYILNFRKNNPFAAIILSMESVFGTIAGWILINQVLDTNKILGCIAIFTGVIIVQLIPIYTNKK